MKAVCCPICKLLVSPGDYGKLAVAATANHRAVAIDGFAELTEGREPGICPGSEMLGNVEQCEPCDKYVTIVFLQGEHADAALAVLDNDGPEAAAEFLAREYGDTNEFEPALEPFGAPADDHFESEKQPGLVLSWNSRLNYIGLAAKVKP